MTEFVLKSDSTPWASRKLARAVVCILSESLAGEALLHEFDLVLTEACANVVRHAYLNGNVGELEITVRMQRDEFVELEVADWGIGICEEKRTIADPGPDAEGGRGLFIMSRLADDFSIHQDNGKNYIRFKKSIEASAWIPCES